MSSSNVGVSNSTNPYGVQAGGTLNYNNTAMNYQNPGLMDPSQLNPAAADQIAGLKGLESKIGEAMPGSSWYQNMEKQQGEQLGSSLQNQYAAMGLSGSSAAMGALAQAGIQNDQAWTSRQLSDSMRSAQGQAGLMQQGYQDTMGIQNQYGNFEDAYNQSIANLLGLQQQQSESNMALGAGIIEAGLGAGGTAAGAAVKGGG